MKLVLQIAAGMVLGTILIELGKLALSIGAIAGLLNLIKPYPAPVQTPNPTSRQTAPRPQQGTWSVTPSPRQEQHYNPTTGPETWQHNRNQE